MRYDLIIAGGGLAGLSLLFHLRQHSQFFSTKKILLIDRQIKAGNDRTWCFWQKGEGDFDELLRFSWSEVEFKSKTFKQRLCLTPYKYKMLQSGDFYRFMDKIILENDNITRVFDEVLHIETKGEDAVVTTQKNSYTASACANSVPLYKVEKNIVAQVPNFIPPPINPENKSKSDLLQHFKGWTIQTSTPAFDINRATLMDFTVQQYDDCRFVYVLPTDEKTALVEYTVFSPTLLSQQEYDNALQNYIINHLQIDQFEIIDKEFGVIPMSTANFPARIGNQVICIGTAGGNTKTSTGYTFMNIQKETKALAAYLAAQKPLANYQSAVRNPQFAFYDATLLNVVATKKLNLEMIFTTMFSKNSVQKIFQFLDNETSLLDDFKIMSSMNIPIFLPAAMRTLFRKK